MADEEGYEHDKNDSQGFSPAEEDVYLESESGDFALQRLVRTTAGQDLYVSSIAQSALGMGNWGGLLGAAPDALGRLGQCFVLASDPLAATLTIPEKAGLPYRSLRANLVECSDKGRTAFRDAERKMKKVSNLALAVCEPGGTIDQILEAVEDDDLAELDLPEQLATLKRISTSCVKDTTELKMKVDDWGKFAKSIHKACVDGDQDLGSKEKGLGDQIEVKELSVKLKHAAVDESKNQTAEYRRQLAARQESHDKAEKANSRGALVDFALNVGDTALHMAKSYLNPLSAINLTFGSRQADTDNHYEPNSHTCHEEEDPGVNLAETLLPIFHRVAELLTYGPDENAGVDWDSLTGHADRSNDINCILSCLRDVQNRFVTQQSGTIRQISTAYKPGEEAILEIQGLVKSEQNLGSNMHMTLTQRAPIWRKQVTDAESGIADRLSTLLEAAKEAQTNRKEAQNKGRKTKMSRAEIRFEQFRMAQQALFDAEGRLNKRLEEDLKMTEEFNAMQLELQRLLTSKATMSQVKEIVGECVSHLHYFCEKLDELASFFAMLQSYIEEMESTRVNPFSTMASTTKQLSDRAKAETSEDKKKKKEKIKQKKLDDLRLRALELKGYYLVAKAMADTYTEVSAGYIIPGVNRIERLSLPDAKNLTKEERAAKISEVGILAKNAKDEVKRIANQRKKEMIRAMADNRGEIEEQQAIESS